MITPKIYIITEGQTETAFVNRVLKPYFKDKYFFPIMVETKVDKRVGKVFKGGVSNFQKKKNTIIKTIKSAEKDKNSYITTMFDFYAIPSDTPGLSQISTVRNPYDKVKKIEDAIFTEFSSFYRFFPYIQLHEFETLLYSDLTILEEECFDSDISKLKEEVKMYTNPELINNSPETAPSKRIIRYIHGYDKVKNGVNVVNKIGIDKLCKQCRHFSEWIDKINKISINKHDN